MKNHHQKLHTKKKKERKCDETYEPPNSVLYTKDTSPERKDTTHAHVYRFDLVFVGWVRAAALRERKKKFFKECEQAFHPSPKFVKVYTNYSYIYAIATVWKGVEQVSWNHNWFDYHFDASVSDNSVKNILWFHHRREVLHASADWERNILCNFQI